MKAHEVNFDGIVGPTHNYAGLSFGNLASQKHERSVSHPKEAALQGLAKMKYLADLGLKQAVLPPQERPDFPMLRRLGFGGSDADVLAKVSKEDHFTPANLVTQFHRSIETPATRAILKAIFPDESAFAHHPPLPATPYLSDEGAANHTRLCEHYGSPGIELFVYGRDASNPTHNPAVFPARQTRQASSAIARVHLLDPQFTTIAQQNPNAIDAGVFHNDVVSVGNGNVLLYHASAYAESPAVMDGIRQKVAGRSSVPLHLIEISEEQVPLKDAIATYLFNSQLVTLPEGGMSLIAPVECRENERVEQVVQQIIAADTPIQSVHYLDVRQSMKNGGGPACLRLRVVLTERELSLVHPGVLLTDSLHGKLVAWVSRHYRETLRPEDLADPKLASESRSALEELYGILGLKSIYAFQN
jgi:succinylarginine dihydrolase